MHALDNLKSPLGSYIEKRKADFKALR